MTGVQQPNGGEVPNKLKRQRSWLIAGLAVAVLIGSVAGFAVAPQSATAAPNSLRIKPAPAVIQPAGTLTLALEAEAPAALLGAWDLRVTFNDSVIHLTNPATPCTGQSNCNLISPGVLGVNGFNANGLSGTQTLASFQFTAVGSPGQSSAIGIQVIAFTDPNADATNPAVASGLVTIQATPSPTPAPLPRTPSLTASPAATPTPAPSPSPSPSPSPTALPAAATPRPEPSAPPAVTAPLSDKTRPSVVRSVPTLGDLSLNAGVASTNLLLAFVTLVILILTAAVLNQTLEENERRIHGVMANISAPFASVFGGLSRATGGTGEAGGIWLILAPIIGLAFIAGLYGLEEPGAGFNDRTLVLFLSYFGAFALATFVFEGVQWLLDRRYGARAIIRVFPIGIFVAIAAVLVTKVTGFQPGLMYGFVAANAIVSDSRLTREQEGKHALYPSLALLAACLVAWGLADPFRTFAEDNPDWWNAIPEGIAVGLFVSGLQSLFFQLLPLDFMDGRKLFDWNKAWWLLISLASGFLFWHVLLNDSKETVDAMGATSTIVALAVVLSALAATIALWMFFRALGPEERQPEVSAGS